MPQQVAKTDTRHGATRVDLAHPTCMNAMQRIGLVGAVVTARDEMGMLLAAVSSLLLALPLLLSPPLLLLLVLVLAVVVMSLSVMVAVMMVTMTVMVVIQSGGRHRRDYQGGWRLPGGCPLSREPMRRLEVIFAA